MKKPISSSISRLLTISVLACLSISALAQEKKIVQLEEKDTIPLFRGVAVSADLVGLAQLAFSDYGQYEAALRVNLRDKYFPVLELGYGKCDATDGATNVTYKTNAPYVKLGVDYNMMKNKHDINRVYGGARYAFTTFDYDISSPSVPDPVWQDGAGYGVEGVKGNFHWVEFIVGIDAKIWGPVRMGWSVRYRRRLLHKEGEIGPPYYVPGFGKYDNSNFGGTFHLTFEL